MPPSRRSGVTTHSSRPHAEVELPAVSRTTRTTIRPGRKSTKSQRFMKESDPLLKPAEATGTSMTDFRPRQLPDNGDF